MERKVVLVLMLFGEKVWVYVNIIWGRESEYIWILFEEERVSLYEYYLRKKGEFIGILFEEERVCLYGYYLRKKEGAYKDNIWRVSWVL